MRLFIGYDSDEPLAYSVFAHSVLRRASVPVQIIPIMLSQLKAVFNRPREKAQSTEFAFTRFLVPYLCNYKGWAIFCDGDMICRTDISELWELRDDSKAVIVVQHDLAHKQDTKFLGRPQSQYPRKNWSSVMLINCAECWRWTPEYIKTAPGLDLHQFKVIPDRAIGSLPRQWNHLVGVDEPNAEAKIVHFTLGLPFWHGYGGCEFAGEWRDERDAMLHYKRETE